MLPRNKDVNESETDTSRSDPQAGYLERPAHPRGKCDSGW